MAWSDVVAKFEECSAAAGLRGGHVGETVKVIEQLEETGDLRALFGLIGELCAVV
jgi:hypothetical protein